MNDSDIETVTNNLAGGYKELEKGTFQEASEVQNQRRTNTDLRNKWVYTAHASLARLAEGDIEFGLTGRPGFDAIAGENIDEFTRQILHDGVYQLTTPQIQLLPTLGDVVWAKASDLELHRETDEWSGFRIDTSDIRAEGLNEPQRPFAVKVHGSLEAKYDPKQELPDYGENMNMLRKEGKIKQTRLWLPAPSYIEQYLQEGIVVARASRLYSFVNDSSFDAYSRIVCSRSALRGVRVFGEADAQKIREVAELLGKPRAQEVLAASLTPDTFPGYEHAGALYRQANPGK